MSDKVMIAEDLFNQGCNCCQSVFTAYADEVGLDKETALKLSSSFGGGMGQLREVCGAVSAMFMIAGLKYGYIDPKDKLAKAEHNKRIQELAQKFKEENGSIICRELLEEKTKDGSTAETQKNNHKSSCMQFVKSAASIMEQYTQE